MDEASKVARMNERDRKIEEEEGLYPTEKRPENYCSRIQTHIKMMYKLGGEHLKDIPRYIQLLEMEKCPKWQEEKEHAEKSGYHTNTELAKSDEMKKQTDQEKIEGLIEKFNLADKYDDAGNIFDEIVSLMQNIIKLYPENLEKYQTIIENFKLKLIDLEKQKGGNKSKNRKSKKSKRSKKSKKSKKTKSRRH